MLMNRFQNSMETKPQKVAHTSAQKGKVGRPRKDGTKRFAVDDLQKIVYPGFEKDMQKELEQLRFNPVVKCVEVLNKIEALFDAKKDTLTMQEVNIFGKTYIQALTAMMPYTYAKKQTDVSFQSLSVTADYSDYIDQLHNKVKEKAINNIVIDSIAEDNIEDSDGDDDE